MVLLCASLALNLTGTVELPPAIALGVMGTLIALPAVAAATDRSRTLINGDSIAFGEPRAHPDVRWSTRDVLAVELHRPSRKVPPALRPRRPPEPWRVRLRNSAYRVIDVMVDLSRERIVVATQGRGVWRAPLVRPVHFR